MCFRKNINTIFLYLMALGKSDTWNECRKKKFLKVQFSFKSKEKM